jgi:energy-coupling factor transport system permease protein
MMSIVLKKENVDPRVKIFIVMCISTLAILINDIAFLSYVLLVSILFTIGFKVDLYIVIKKFKRLFQMIFIIVIIQSIFNGEGTTLISISKVTLLTDIGLIKGIEYILRMLIIISSALILSTSSSVVLLQGLLKCKIPYDLAFMVCIGLRFIPILSEEIKDTFIAIQIRGINIKKLKLKKKLELVSITLMPVVIGTIDKSKKLSASIESRGFRRYPTRTSIYELRFSLKDYFLIWIIIGLSGLIVFSYFK